MVAAIAAIVDALVHQSIVSSIRKQRAGAEKRYPRHLGGPQQMASGQMTRGAAISIALLALIALMLIILPGRHGGAANSPAGADLTSIANPNVARENPDAPLT